MTEQVCYKKFKMEFLIELLPVISSFVIGGGITALFTVKQDKQTKDLSNLKLIIQEYKDLNEQLKREKDEAIQEINQKRKTIDELQDAVDKLEKEMATMQQRLAQMELFYKNADMLKCELIACKNRIPPMEKDKQKLLKKTVVVNEEDRCDDRGE